MNKFYGVGRLTADPEVRYTQTGKPVTSFTLAINQAPRQGQENGEVDYIDFVAWGPLAENCGNTLKKGDRVFAEGRLRIRSYEDREGIKRRVSEVIAATVAPALQSWESRENRQAYSSAQSTRPSPAEQFGNEVLPDEDIPF